MITARLPAHLAKRHIHAAAQDCLQAALAVKSFLDSVLDKDPARREAARDYLQNALARENAGVTVERSKPS